MEETVMRGLEILADRYFDGHFTIMRFTTNWRICFGTPQDREDISTMSEGRTLFEAYSKALTTLIDVKTGKGIE